MSSDKPGPDAVDTHAGQGTPDSVRPDGETTPSSTYTTSLVDGVLSINEEVNPGSGEIYNTRAFDPVEHNTKTRRYLAVGSLSVLAAFYGVVLGFFLGRLIRMDEVTALIAAFGGIQTLAAAAFGFYFATKDS